MDGAERRGNGKWVIPTSGAWKLVSLIRFNPALGVPVGETNRNSDKSFLTRAKAELFGRKLNRGHIDSNLKMEVQ